MWSTLLVSGVYARTASYHVHHASYLLIAGCVQICLIAKPEKLSRSTGSVEPGGVTIETFQVAESALDLMETMFISQRV
jgi:hypothetical protein